MPAIHEFLQPLSYHLRIVEYLKAEEPATWDWFASQKSRTDFADSVRLDLLKTAYRLERATHPEAYALADEVLVRFDLAAPVTLYQSQQAAGLNAALHWLPGEAHVVLVGPMLTALSPVEARAVIAHELAHFVLWEGWGHEHFVAGQVLGAMARHPRAEPSHGRTARLHDLYTEIYADRGSLHAIGDPRLAVSALVKTETGLATVSADDYLRQADEIVARDPAASRAQGHPETFLRARAVRLWADAPAEAPARIEAMIEGEPALDDLDLLGQRRLAGVTRRLLRRLLADPRLRSDALLAHARLFFDDFVPAEPAELDPALADDLRRGDPALRDYFCSLLLDFAAADPELEDVPLVAAFALAEPVGLGDRLQELAVRDLKKRKKALEKVRAAAASPPPEPNP